MQRSSNASCRQHAGSLGGERSREMLAGWWQWCTKSYTLYLDILILIYRKTRYCDTLRHTLTRREPITITI